MTCLKCSKDPPLRATCGGVLYLSCSRTSWASLDLLCCSVSRACSMVQENWGRAGRESRARWQIRVLVLAWVSRVWKWPRSRSRFRSPTPGASVFLEFWMREQRFLWRSLTHWRGSAHRFRSPFSNRKSSSVWWRREETLEGRVNGGGAGGLVQFGWTDEETEVSPGRGGHLRPPPRCSPHLPAATLSEPGLQQEPVPRTEEDHTGAPDPGPGPRTDTRRDRTHLGTQRTGAGSMM